MNIMDGVSIANIYIYYNYIDNVKYKLSDTTDAQNATTGIRT